jgi:hypothetical protein
VKLAEATDVRHNPSLARARQPSWEESGMPAIAVVRSHIHLAFTLAGVIGFGAAVRGTSLTPGNVLVSNLGTGVLTEYTTAGASVQTFTFPDFSGGFHDLRDIVVGNGGSVHAYNGTFDPRMSSLQPATSAIANQSFAGWSTVNNISYGGIGAFGDGVFVTDMATAGAGDVGVVRFSTSGAAPVRFGSSEYTDLTIGGDGLLYALRGAIDVYNPTTNAFVRTINLDGTVSGADIRGIAVGADGTIYAAGWNGSVYAATSNGAFLGTRNTGASNLTDIDLNDLGQLVVGSRFGTVILTDTSLASQTSFQIGGSFGPTIHVAFTTPLSVPEPTTTTAATAMLALAGASITRRRWRYQSGRPARLSRPG